jgi:hypothetical protein
MSTNPLSSYLRKPEIYVKLPSGGRWWPEGSLVTPPNGEFPVMAMNGHDDLAMRNADGLMNGASSVAVIQSCVPNVKDAWSGPTMDIEYLFVAIRIASYGSEMESEGKCKQCRETTKFGVNLSGILEQMQFPDFDTPVQIGDLYFMLKPASYQLTDLTNQQIFEKQRALLTVQSSDLTLEQKQKILKETIQKLGEITVSKLIEYVDYVMLPDGSRVYEREYLQEFIDQADRKSFNKLKRGIEEKNRQYTAPDLPFVCSNPECNHENVVKFEFNPSNFFAADS